MNDSTYDTSCDTPARGARKSGQDNPMAKYGHEHEHGKEYAVCMDTLHEVYVYADIYLLPNGRARFMNSTDQWPLQFCS